MESVVSVVNLAAVGALVTTGTSETGWSPAPFFLIGNMS